jgi:hypothetical protein
VKSEPIVESPKVTPNLPDSYVWELFGNNSFGIYYYNKTNITKSSDIISVWIYQTPTDDSKEGVIESVKKNNLEKSIKYKNYEHTMGLNEIDCKNRKVLQTNIIFYDDKNNILDNYTIDNSKWTDIPPDSLFNILYNKICVIEEKPYVEPPKVEPPKVEPPKVELPNVEPPKVESPKVEPPKVELPNVEPPKVEPPKVEPTIPDSKVWEYFGKDSGGGVYYYNKTSMTNIISFKLYYIVTDDERKERIERIKKYDLKKSVEYQNYDHDISEVEIDCNNKLTKVKEFTEYDNQGNVLKHNVNKDSEWKSILPGSREEFYKINCVTPNKPLEKK